ncbi:MAG: phenylalanine--tRNA ligase subunit beta [Candidatus Omnitrophota bacterium]
MRFSLNFIQEFLKVGIPAKDLAVFLTMAGMEVECFEKKGEDWVFDVEVTTNRYDWLSMVGIAREIAAILGKKLKVDYPVLARKPLLDREIIIEDKKDCPYYIGRRLAEVKVGNSPAWLKERITNCGFNSVNNIVDITNYSMLKWGNPLHAFDADKLKGNIYIRRAKKGEFFLGIDGKERVLMQDNLVIADSKKVVALAGVIGAKNTEVDVNTKNVFLEAAIFSPLTIRRSRRVAGLDTESSYRFERVVPPHLLEVVSCEAIKLIEKETGGKTAGYKQVGRKPQLAKKQIAISLNALGAYLGIVAPKQKVTKILTGLDFGVRKISGDKIIVSPSDSRFDINSEVDVYEEFARVYSYSKIPARIPHLKNDFTTSGEKSLYRLKGELADFVALSGFKEIVTCSLEDQGYSNIELINPLRSQEDSLRSSLLLGMVKSIRHNLNRNQSGLRFFEIADIYAKNKQSFLEESNLSLGISGKEEDFFYLKGAVENIVGFFNIDDFQLKEESLNNFTNALGIFIGNQRAGFLGKLNGQAKKKFDLKEDLFFAQISLPAFQEKKRKKKYKPFSPYPTIWRDVSISLKKDIKFKVVEEIIRKKGNYLAGLSIVNIYKGKDITPGYRAFTLRVFYQSSEKTLASGEVDSFHNRIREELGRQAGLRLR